MNKKPQGWHQWALIGLGLACAGLLLIVPLALIFTQALSGGCCLLYTSPSPRDS